MEKLDIILDFDGVIANSVEKIVSLYNKDHMMYKDFSPVDWTTIDSWEFKELTMVSRNHIDDYFDQYRFFQDLNFMENAFEYIYKLSKTHKIKVCSMGNDLNLAYKGEWILKNLPFVDEYIPVNFKDAKDKSHIDMSNAIFIDDSSNNLETSNASVKILYGDEYEWNRGYNGLRCWNWKEVYEYIEKVGVLI
jgi:5'(3')-deoxyribonucleotidase